MYLTEALRLVSCANNMFRIIQNPIEYCDPQNDDIFDSDEFTRIRFSKPNRSQRVNSEIREILEKGRAKKFTNSRNGEKMLI